MNFQIPQKLPVVAEKMYQQIMLKQQIEQVQDFTNFNSLVQLPASCCIRITSISYKQSIDNKTYYNIPVIQQLNQTKSSPIYSYMISSIQQDKRYYKNLKGFIQQFISGKEIISRKENVCINNTIGQETPFILQTNDKFTISFEVQNNNSNQLVLLTDEQQVILQQNVNRLSRLSIPRYMNNLEITKSGIELKSEIQSFLQQQQQFITYFNNLNDKQLVVQKQFDAQQNIDVAILYYSSEQILDKKDISPIKHIDAQLLHQALKRFRFAEFIYNTIDNPEQQYHHLLVQSKQLFGNQQIFPKTEYSEQIYEQTLNSINAQFNILRDTVVASTYTEQKQ